MSSTRAPAELRGLDPLARRHRSLDNQQVRAHAVGMPSNRFGEALKLAAELPDEERAELARELIRSLARKLAENNVEAARIRASMSQVSYEPARKGGILAALRRSPLVGAELNFARPRIDGRRVDL